MGIIRRTQDNIHQLSSYGTRDKDILRYVEEVGAGYFFNALKTICASQLETRIGLFKQDMEDERDAERA